MKSLILYSALTPLTPLHRFVQSTVRDDSRLAPHPIRPRNPAKEEPYGACYIRAEVFDGDIDEALDAARPLEGETVLNTIPLNA